MKGTPWSLVSQSPQELYPAVSRHISGVDLSVMDSLEVFGMPPYPRQINRQLGTSVVMDLFDAKVNRPPFNALR